MPHTPQIKARSFRSDILTVLPVAPAAQIQPVLITPDLTGAIMVPIYTTAIIVVGILIALAIALRKTDSKDRAAVIRAVAEVFRWFRRGGPPSGVA